MTRHSKQVFNLARMRDLLAILFVYASSVGLFYLWGYWGQFKINFLEYVSLTDILPLSLIALIPVTIITALMSSFIFGVDHVSETMEDQNQELTNSEIAIYVFTTIISIVLVAKIFLTAEPWMRWALLVILIVAMALGARHSIKALSGIKSATQFILATAILLFPSLSYIAGATRGQAMLTGDSAKLWPGQNFKWVEQTADQGYVTDGTQLIGILGDFAFFLEEDSKIHINRTHSVMPMKLIPSRKISAKD